MGDFVVNMLFAQDNVVRDVRDEAMRKACLQRAMRTSNLQANMLYSRNERTPGGVSLFVLLPVL